jgi:uncharacterized protein
MSSDLKGAAMAAFERYIPGVPCWVDTSQPDPEAAVRFYSGLFGWEFEDVMPAGAPGSYFVARLRGADVAAVASLPDRAPRVAAWNTYVWVQSADETTSKVTAAGGTILSEPFDVHDAGRMAVFADPDGAVFSVWQAGRHRGALIVNEPGSLNFNGLNTRSAPTAREFYRAVFGWQTLALGEAEMWTLPGYGDHLERHRPGFREQMAAMGVPGFADVVASLHPIADDQADARTHWSVTFTVHDADATAEQAIELGGKVLVAPFDAPWVRTTVIADPQGATLIASKFAPENRDLADREHTSAATR